MQPSTIILSFFLVSAAATPDIIQVLKAEKFDKLLEALEKNNLTGALKGNGPFTLFAPTDKAFKNFAANKPDYQKYYTEHPDKVRLLLANHVIPKIIKTVDLKNDELLEPLSKQYLRSNIYGMDSSKTFTLNGVIIPSEPSFQASNGVIYAIDDLLMCTAYDTIYETLVELYNDKYSHAIKGLKMTKLMDDLKKGDPFTLFVFSNKAFEDIPNGKKMVLISNTEKLRSLMRGYLVPGTYYKNGLSTGTLKAIDNSVVQTVVDGTTMTVNGANIIESDILAGNGVIHVIDKVNIV